MKIRVLLLTLACSLLMTGCITAGYDYRGDGYYHGGTTIEYRSNRGYPYGYYDGYYGYGYPYGYESRYGYDARYRYSYPYGYGGYYGYYGQPGPYYRSRPVYPRYDGRYNGHDGGYPHRQRPPGNHSNGKPPWRDLERIPQPGRGHSIAPPSGTPTVPAPSFRPSVGGGEDRPSQPRRERGRLQGEIKAAEDRE